MGSASYHRRFVKDFAKFTLPLANLTKSAVKIVWDDKCQEAFDLIKKKLTTTLILATPDWNKEFMYIVTHLTKQLEVFWLGTFRELKILLFTTPTDY